MLLLETACASNDTNYVYPQVLSTVQHGGCNSQIPKLLTLDPDTRFSDLISQSVLTGPGLLCSTRMANLLARFSVQDHTQETVQVSWRSEVRPYLWWMMRGDPLDHIDVAASEFNQVDLHGRSSPATFCDAPELNSAVHEWIENLSSELQPRRLVWKVGSPVLDLFTIMLTRRIWLVSDRLAGMLQERRYTGLEFRLLRRGEANHDIQ
jgi:hypothetical protein